MRKYGVIKGSGEWTVLTKHLHRRRENVITLEKFDKMFEKYQDGKFEHPLPNGMILVFRYRKSGKKKFIHVSYRISELEKQEIYCVTIRWMRYVTKRWMIDNIISNMRMIMIDRLLASGQVKVNGLNPVLQLSQAGSFFTENYWKGIIHDIRREYILGKGWMSHDNRYLADLEVFIG